MTVKDRSPKSFRECTMEDSIQCSGTELLDAGQEIMDGSSLN